VNDGCEEVEVEVETLGLDFCSAHKAEAKLLLTMTLGADQEGRPDRIPCG
jgi:hypothetical protein